MQRFENLPNGKIPVKVRLESYSCNELVFNTGERIKVFLPQLNTFNSHGQVMSSTEEWEASLFPWSERWDKEIEKRQNR